MRISDRWEIVPDANNWSAIQHVVSHNNEGERVVSKIQTWHADLAQVAEKIVREDTKMAQSMGELKDMLRLAVDSVEGFLTQKQPIISNK